MLRHLLLPLFATSFLVSPVLAQSKCKPEAVQNAIDAYSTAPFGAAAWRKMTGLGDPGTTAQSYAYDDAAGETWRKLAAELAPGNETLSNPGYDCRLGYATDVLQARITGYGKTSGFVQQWLRGQEVVLKACAGQSATMADAPMPTNLTPAETEVMKFDRAYQQASLLFYVKSPEAVPAFKTIAASASPHKAAARYNIANILANARNVVEARTEAKAILADASLASVHDITRELLGYIANIEDTASGWSELLDQTVATLNQPASAITSNKKAEAQYTKALFDIGFAGITDKKDDWWVTNTLPENPTLSKAIAEAARKHPMVLFMLAGQSVYKPQTHAPWALQGSKWQAWSVSYVDRAAALQAEAIPDVPKSALESLKAGTDDASRAKLWAQAQTAADQANASCGEASQTGAVTILALQAVRVSALAKRYDEIYAKLPKLKLDGTASLAVTILPKLMEQVLATGEVEEGRRLRDTFITDALLSRFDNPENVYQASPYATFMAWVAEDEARWLKAVAMMTEKLSPTVLNLLPAAKLRELGDNTQFSEAQRGLLKRAAWTRNFARGLKNSDKTTTDMLAANPEISAAYETVRKEFPKLKSDRLWLLTILRNPRFGILVNSPDWTDPIEAKRDNFAALDDYDANDKNWWCPLEPDRQLGALRTDYSEATLMTGVRDYNAKTLAPLLDADAIASVDAAREAVLKQHPMIKAVAWEEVASLAKAPSAPQLLAREAVRWGKVSKGEDGAPEALALAVRATRYGCRWHGSVKAYSKPAQELLKTKFATSSWTAQTRYWFDCTDVQYDANYNKITSCKPREWPKQSLPR